MTAIERLRERVGDYRCTGYDAYPDDLNVMFALAILELADRIKHIEGRATFPTEGLD